MFFQTNAKEKILKSKIGTVLLKISSDSAIRNLNDDEKATAKVLESQELLKYKGPPDAPFRMAAEDYHIHQAALFHAVYTITGNGVKLLNLYTEQQLRKGLFKLPGEKEWHETFRGKVILSGVTALITYVIAGALQYLLGKIMMR